MRMMSLARVFELLTGAALAARNASGLDAAGSGGAGGTGGAPSSGSSKHEPDAMRP